MRVLVVSTVRFRFNGITSVILNYYRNMDKADMQIDFVVPNEVSDDYKAEFKANHSVCYQLNRKGNIIQYFYKLRKILRDGKYDIIHIHGNSSMMLLDVLPAYLEKVPIRIVHSHNTTCNHKLLHRVFNPFFGRCYTHSFACGNDAGKWLYGKKNFIELKNVIDTNEYKFNILIREEYRLKLNAGNKTVIGHVGNFIEQKNHRFLLDVYFKLLKKNSNYLLLLISDGILMEEMINKARKLGVFEQVVFLGKTADVNNYLQAMDVFVLPSLYEGLPVVLIEAQSSGLPILVSNKVSKESNISKNMTFLSIDDTNCWVDNILELTSKINEIDRNLVSCSNIKKIIDAGYDIKENAKILKDYYNDFLDAYKSHL